AALRAADLADVLAQPGELVGRRSADEVLLEQEVREADELPAVGRAAPIGEAGAPLQVVRERELVLAARARKRRAARSTGTAALRGADGLENRQDGGGRQPHGAARVEPQQGAVGA